MDDLDVLLESLDTNKKSSSISENKEAMNELDDLLNTLDKKK